MAGTATFLFHFYPNQCCQCFHICINEKGRAYVCGLMEGEAVSEFNLSHIFFDDIFTVMRLKIKGIFLKGLRIQSLTQVGAVTPQNPFAFK